MKAIKIRFFKRCVNRDNGEVEVLYTWVIIKLDSIAYIDISNNEIGLEGGIRLAGAEPEDIQRLASIFEGHLVM